MKDYVCVSTEPSRVCGDSCIPYSHWFVSLECKCWLRGDDVPEEVKKAQKKGYMTHPPKEPSPLVKRLTIRNDIGCHPYH